MPINPFLEFGVGVIVLPFLVYASYSDIKTREISNWVWVVLLLIGLPLNIFRVILYFNDFPVLLQGVVCVFLGASLGVLLALMGLWGEADSKGLICMSFVSPLFPFAAVIPLIGTINAIIPMSLAYFMNGYLFLLPLLPLFPIYNLIGLIRDPERYSFPQSTLWKRIVAFCTGYPADVETLKSKGIWDYDFLERPTENGIWVSALRIGLSEPEEDAQRKRAWLETAIQEGKKTVWVQTGYPAFVTLTLGYITAMLFGNILVVFATQAAMFFIT